MNYDEWWDTFKPIKNHINDGHGWDGCMFETYGPELEFIQTTTKPIWTLLDSGHIVEDYHVINRFGYFITENPPEPNTRYEVLP